MPCVLHTAYDALLMFGTGLSFIAFLGFDVFMVVYCFGTVNRMSKIQRNLTNNVRSGAITANNGVIQYTAPQVQTPNPGVAQAPAPGVYNFCPICGTQCHGSNFCGSCGYKLK